VSLLPFSGLGNARLELLRIKAPLRAGLPGIDLGTVEPDKVGRRSWCGAFPEIKRPAFFNRTGEGTAAHGLPTDGRHVPAGRLLLHETVPRQTPQGLHYQLTTDMEALIEAGNIRPPIQEQQFKDNEVNRVEPPRFRPFDQRLQMVQE
jgi:hypothetical protein